MTELVLNRPDAPPFEEEQLIELVLNGVSSAHSRRAYRTGLAEFFAWIKLAPMRPDFTKALVQEYRAHLEGRILSFVPGLENDLNPRSGELRKLSASTINLRMATIKKLADELANNGLLDQNAAAAIGRAKGVPQHGGKQGTGWCAERPTNCFARPIPTRSKACGTGPSWRCCSAAVCAAPSCSA